MANSEWRMENDLENRVIAIRYSPLAIRARRKIERSTADISS
jgi:hypothetical protein